MTLYLVQHGKSLPKEIDPQKGLSDEGISDVTRIASVAQNYNVQVKKILHSGKKRAIQTASIFSDALQPQQGVSEMTGMNPLDDVESFAPKLEAEANTMLVGHLPFMERLLSRLITGTADYSIFKFQNGGIVCLDKEEGRENWFIKWALMPEVH